MKRLRRRIDEGLDRLFRRLRLSPPAFAPSLLGELSRYFLAELIDDRVTWLVQREGGAGAIDSIRRDISGRYTELLAAAVLRHCPVELAPQAERAAWTALAAPESLVLFAALDDAAFASPAAFARRVARLRSDPRYRAALRSGPTGALPPARIAHVVLSAVQQVGPDIVMSDYARARTPPATLEAVWRLMARVDAIAQRVAPEPAVLSLETLDAKLQVALARNEGRVWLPLRPIDTAALQFADVAERYSGRSDDDARRLARQIRHADGVVLVTGYRGVGKSTFVNRALYHATSVQARAPADGWIVVPVALSLAKASSVANVLRLTLRAIREALIDPVSGRARPVPHAAAALPLPLADDERQHLDLAYIRATLKVTMSRSQVDETGWDLGAKAELDPGVLVGHSIGKLLSFGAKRSRQRKASRELSLLDYDEDGAEADIGRLIDSLARARPLAPGAAPAVRIKLALVFDELDKMDLERGLLPMLEGLKNLFLRRHAVFMLVTSKRLYYDLLDQRAVEDATLSSYFSLVVHVPLLTSAQVHALLSDWIDRGVMKSFAPRADDAEKRLLDRLSRYLTYRSFGNPRDIVRELRQMQLWADSTDRPYLTDRIARSPEVAVFAAIQEAVELVASPWQGANAATSMETGATATLASERVSADEARLEQIRRGLYILVETLIDSQTLLLEAKALEGLREHNFSLLSAPDVLQLARQLGSRLAILSSAVVDSDALREHRPTQDALFLLETRDGGGTVLYVTGAFYALTGRRAAQVDAPIEAAAGLPRSPQEVVDEARRLATHPGRSEQSSAIGLIGRLDAADVPADLHDFLARMARDADPLVRLSAVERMPRDTLLSEPFDLPASLSKEGDDRVVAAYLGRLKDATTPDQQRVATNGLLALLGCDGASARPLPSSSVLRTGVPSDASVTQAFRVLEVVADRDVTRELINFLKANAS